MLLLFLLLFLLFSFLLLFLLLLLFLALGIGRKLKKSKGRKKNFAGQWEIGRAIKKELWRQTTNCRFNKVGHCCPVAFDCPWEPRLTSGCALGQSNIPRAVKRHWAIKSYFIEAAIYSYFFFFSFAKKLNVEGFYG